MNPQTLNWIERIYKSKLLVTKIHTMFQGLVVVALAVFRDGIPHSGCLLEDQGYCSFAKEDRECHFADMTTEDDLGVSVKDVLNGIITNRDDNKGCRLPKPGDGPFTVKIEPCFNNGTQAGDTGRIRCEDPTIEFFTKHLQRVIGIPKDKTVVSDEIDGDKHHEMKSTPHIVTGKPAEINIVRLGKAYVLGNKDNPRDATNPLIKGLRINRFKFRTLPLHEMAYSKYHVGAKDVYNAFFGNANKRVDNDNDGTDNNDETPESNTNASKAREYREKIQRKFHPVTAPEGWAEIDWELDNPDDHNRHTQTAYVPKPAFACPMQIVFDDRREPQMSADQQIENIIPMKVDMVNDLPRELEAAGIGCMMCITPKKRTIEETLLQEPNWNRQFSDFCNIRDGQITPYMRSTDMDNKGDVNFRPDHLYSDVPAGIYTLYPYFEQPAPGAHKKNPSNDRDEFHFHKLADGITKYLDPAYAITIEITGMQKSIGTRIIRNFHGRLLEKGLVDTQYYFHKHPGAPVFHVENHDEEFFKHINKDTIASDEPSFFTKLNAYMRELPIYKRDLEGDVWDITSNDETTILEVSGMTDEDKQFYDRDSDFPVTEKDLRTKNMYDANWQYIVNKKQTEESDQKWYEQDFVKVEWPDEIGHASSQLCNIRRRAICKNGRITPMKHSEKSMSWGSGANSAPQSREWGDQDFNEMVLNKNHNSTYNSKDYLPIELSGAILNPLCLMAYQSCRHVPIEDDDQMFIMTFWDYMRWADMVSHYWLKTAQVDSFGFSADQLNSYDSSKFNDISGFVDAKESDGFPGDATFANGPWHKDRNVFYRNRLNNHFSCFLSKYNTYILLDRKYFIKRYAGAFDGHFCSVCDDVPLLIDYLEHQKKEVLQRANVPDSRTSDPTLFNKFNKLYSKDGNFKTDADYEIAPFQDYQLEVLRNETKFNKGFLAIHCTAFDRRFSYKKSQFTLDRSFMTHADALLDKDTYDRGMMFRRKLGLDAQDPDDDHSLSEILDSYDVSSSILDWPDYQRDDEQLYPDFTRFIKRMNTADWIGMDASQLFFIPAVGTGNCEDDNDEETSKKRDHWSIDEMLFGTKNVYVARRGAGISPSEHGCEFDYLNLMPVYHHRKSPPEKSYVTAEFNSWATLGLNSLKSRLEYRVAKQLGDKTEGNNLFHNAIEALKKRAHKHIPTESDVLDRIIPMVYRNKKRDRFYQGGANNVFMKNYDHNAEYDPSRRYASEMKTSLEYVYDGTLDDMLKEIGNEVNRRYTNIAEGADHNQNPNRCPEAYDSVLNAKLELTFDMSMFGGGSSNTQTYTSFDFNGLESAKTSYWDDNNGCTPEHLNMKDEVIKIMKKHVKERYNGNPHLLMNIIGLHSHEESDSGLDDISGELATGTSNYAKKIIKKMREYAIELYALQQVASWEPAEPATCIVGEIYDKEPDLSTRFQCRTEFDDIPAPKDMGNIPKRRNFSVTFSNLYPDIAHKEGTAKHYFGTDKPGCKIDASLMSGLLFDTGSPVNDIDTSLDDNKNCPRVQHHSLWNLAVFFGDSKMIWGDASAAFLSNIVEVPGLGCTITPGEISITSVFGNQCQAFWFPAVKKVETRTKDIHIESCLAKDMSLWWNHLFGISCTYDNGGWRHQEGCIKLRRRFCEDGGNADGCSVGQNRYKAFQWYNWNYDNDYVKQTADSLGISERFFRLMHQRFNGAGLEWSDKIKGKVLAKWGPGTIGAHNELKHHTANRKHPFTDPWVCTGCPFWASPADAIIGWYPLYGGACNAMAYGHIFGLYELTSWTRYTRGMDVPGGTGLPAMTLLKPPTECLYEASVRAYFVDHAQCPNKHTLRHFIDAERYGDYFSCNCYVVKSAKGRGSYATRECCSTEEARRFQGTDPHKQVLFKENDDDVDAIQLWTFTSEEYNYVGEDLPTDEEVEGRHHCPGESCRVRC